MTALMRRPWARGRHAWSLAIEESADTEIDKFDVSSPRRVVHEVLGLHKKKNTEQEVTLSGMNLPKIILVHQQELTIMYFGPRTFALGSAPGNTASNSLGMGCCSPEVVRSFANNTLQYTPNSRKRGVLAPTF